MKIKIDNSGFSLVELLVAIAIFGIMTSLTVINFKTGQDARDLKTDSLKMLEAVKFAQTSALAGQTSPAYTALSYGFALSSSVSSDCQKIGCVYVNTNDDGYKILISEAQLNLSPKTTVASYNKPFVVDFKIPRANVVINNDSNVTSTSLIIQNS